MADPPSQTPQAPRARTTSLVTVGSAAVLAIYAAGYWRTQAAALSQESVGRRDRIVEPAMPAPSLASTDTAPPPLDIAATRATATTDTTAVAPREAAPVVATPVVDTAAQTPPATPPPVEVAPATLPPPPSTPPAAPPSPPATPAVADSATPPAQKPAVRPLKDGSFFGYGSSRHGDLEVKIEVVDRRIVHVEISRCLTRYSCNWIEALPDQVVARQTADVDIISGATVSSDCFYMAVMDAMNTSRAS